MNKPFYSDYVRHTMRFYSRNLKLKRFKNQIDEENWLACYNTIRNYTDREKDILVYVYGSYDTLADNVYEMSKKYSINQSIIWDLMKEVELKIATERGLV